VLEGCSIWAFNSLYDCLTISEPIQLILMISQLQVIYLIYHSYVLVWSALLINQGGVMHRHTLLVNLQPPSKLWSAKFSLIYLWPMISVLRVELLTSFISKYTLFTIWVFTCFGTLASSNLSTSSRGASRLLNPSNLRSSYSCLTSSFIFSPLCVEETLGAWGSSACSLLWWIDSQVME